MSNELVFPDDRESALWKALWDFAPTGTIEWSGNADTSFLPDRIPSGLTVADAEKILAGWKLAGRASETTCPGPTWWFGPGGFHNSTLRIVALKPGAEDEPALTGEAKALAALPMPDAGGKAAGNNLAGFVAADTLNIDEGIQQNRLSEEVRAGNVQTKPAPRGMKDSRGREIRILYHRGDAIAHCKPKRRTPKNARR